VEHIDRSIPSVPSVTLCAGSEPATTASRWFDVREVVVAVDAQWLRVRRSLEERLGVEEASYLMDRPVGGWSELVTNHTLDLKFEVIDARFAALDARFEALEHRLVAEMERRFRVQTWSLITALFAAVGMLGAFLRL
jgi:hypothetical protein